MKTTEEVLEDARNFMGLSSDLDLICEMGQVIGSDVSGLSLKTKKYTIWVGETLKSKHSYRIKVSCKLGDIFNKQKNNITVSFDKETDIYVVRGEKSSREANMKDISDKSSFLKAVGAFIYVNKAYLLTLIDLMNSGSQPTDVVIRSNLLQLDLSLKDKYEVVYEENLVNN